MIRKTSVYAAYTAIFIASFFVNEQPLYASIPLSDMLVSGGFLVIAAVGAVVSFRLSTKVEAVETNLKKDVEVTRTQLSSEIQGVSSGVQGVSTTQQKHGQKLTDIQADIGAMGQDIGKLKTTADEGFNTLKAGQSAIQTKVENESAAIQQKMGENQAYTKEKFESLEARLARIEQMLKKPHDSVSTKSGTPPAQAGYTPYKSPFDSSKVSSS